MPHEYPFGPIIVDTLIKTGAGKIFSLSIIFKGAKLGDFVTLIDGTDITGKDRELVVCPGTTNVHRNKTKEWCQGKSFEVGLFVNIHASTPGTIFVTGDYR